MSIIDKGAGVLLVSNDSELAQAYGILSKGKGGTIELEASSTRYSLDLSDGGTGAVKITSADNDNPAILSELRVSRVHNLEVTDVIVDSVGTTRDSWITDLRVAESENVRIANIEFRGGADGYLTKGNASVASGGKLGDFERGNKGVVFEDNKVSGYFHGLGIFDSDQVTVANNEFTKLQGDGIRMAGSHDVEIVGNYLHDFWGSANDANHDDMVQVWGVNTDRVMKNLRIAENVFDSGDGPASQTIFIRNESVATTGRLQDIEIVDNVIRNGHVNGISVGDADGVVIRNNTLLHNPGSAMYSNAADTVGTSDPPVIRVNKGSDALVQDNIVYSTVLDGYVRNVGNALIDYTDPAAPNFVGSNFVNALATGSLGVRDLRLLEGSVFDGKGSKLTDAAIRSDDGVEAVMRLAPAPEDRYLIEFDAGYSLDEDGAASGGGTEFVWKFADGKVLRGETVERLYDAPGDHDVTLQVIRGGTVVDQITRGFSITPKELVVIDFDSGLVDDSTYASRLEWDGSLVTGSDGKGFKIGGKTELEVARDNGQIHSLDTFGLAFDMKTLAPGERGIFLDFFRVLRGWVEEDGRVTVKLTTDKSDVTITSDRPVFDDSGFHRIGLAFDGVAGQFALFADGRQVAEAEAWGRTAPQTSYGLIFGAESWLSSIPAVIDGIVFSADPAAAGELPAAPAPQPEPEPEPEPKPEPEPQPQPEPQPEPQPQPDPQPVTSSDLWLAFDGNLSNAGGAESSLSLANSGAKEAYAWEGNDGAYHLTGDNSIRFGRSTEVIYDREDFHIGLSLQKTKAGGEGTFLHLHNTLEAEIDATGRVIFSLTTSAGNYELKSAAGLVDDTAEHRIDVRFGDGELELLVDGAVAAETEAQGVTAPVKYWGLHVGHNWGDSIDAYVDDFVFGDLAGDYLL